MSERHLIIVTSVYPPSVAGPGVYFSALKDALEKRGWRADVLVRPTLRHLWDSVPFGGTVLVHGTPKIVFAIFLVKMLKRCKVVVRVGGDFFWERAVEEGRYWGTLRDYYLQGNWKSIKEWMLFKIFGRILAMMDAVVWTSNYVRDILAPRFGLQGKKCFVVTQPIPYGMNPARDARVSRPEIRMLFAGRYIKLKNLVMFIEMLAKIRERHEEVTLTLIGEGPVEHRIRNVCQIYDLAKAVTFKKPMARDMLLKEIADHDLVVVPSLSEVSPNVLLDAVAAGTPALATQENGLKEVLGEAVTWFDPMSKKDLYAKLESLITPENLAKARQRMKACAYRKSMDDVAREFENNILTG